MTHPDDLYADAQRARLSRRWRIALLALALVVVASGTAFALTGPLSADDEDPASSAPSATTTPAPSTTRAFTGAPDPAACRTRLGPDDPLRLWIGGDSLAGSLGPALGAITGETGVVQPVFHSRVSSGLRSADFFNWPARAPEDLLKYDPEVVVFIIGANDAKGLSQAAKTDEIWRAEYVELVDEMVTLLIGEGRRVYWVGAPIMKDRAYSERVQLVNEVFQEVIARHPEAHYVDSYDLFADEDGKYASSLPTEDDDSTPMRAGDGVHLTTDGGLRIADAVFAQLDPACRITRQAVDGEEKKTIEVRGSTQNPGNRRTDVPSQPATTMPATTAPSTVPVTSTLPVTTTVPPVSVPQISVPVPPTAPCVPPGCRSSQQGASGGSQ